MPHRLILSNRLNASVQLPVIQAIEDGKPIWVQIAREGVFKGHPSSPNGATFTREMFAKLVENFRRNPSYHAGPDGLGDTKVIPTDYEHASELPPTDGSIPQKGASSPAWVLELQTRNAADGSAELWAYTLVTSPELKAQLLNQEYRWTSVAVWSDAIDPVSGQPIGPLLTSYAFTNHPFIQGMKPIVASAWVSVADSPAEALIGLRDVFGLPANASAQDVQLEVAQLAQLLASGVELEGVEPESLIAQLRTLLGMRTLATRDEVLSRVSQLLDALVTPQSQGTTPEQGTDDMDMKELTARLATTLKCKDDPVVILAAADKAAGDSDAYSQLATLVGGKTFQDVFKNATECVQQAAKVADLVEQVKASMELKGKVEDAAANAETDAVVASMGVAPELAARMRPGIFALRKDAIGDAKKLEAFHALYPLPPAQLTALTQSVFATAGGAQLTMSAQPGAQSVPLTMSARGTGETEASAKVAKFTGRNVVEKAVTMLSAERAGFKDMPWSEKVHQASQWARENNLL